jgi:hypothetical protein
VRLNTSRLSAGPFSNLRDAALGSTPQSSNYWKECLNQVLQDEQGDYSPRRVITVRAGIHSVTHQTLIEMRWLGERDWRSRTPPRYRSAASVCWQAALEPFPAGVRSDSDEVFVPWPLETFAGNEPCCSQFQRRVSQGLNSRSGWPACVPAHAGAAGVVRRKSY